MASNVSIEIFVSNAESLLCNGTGDFHVWIRSARCQRDPTLRIRMACAGCRNIAEWSQVPICRWPLDPKQRIVKSYRFSHRHMRPGRGPRDWSNKDSCNARRWFVLTCFWYVLRQRPADAHKTKNKIQGCTTRFMEVTRARNQDVALAENSVQ